MLFVEVWLRNGHYTAAEYFGRFWYEIAIEFQLWIYLGAVWFKVHRYEIMIRNTFSSIESITLAWIRKVLIAFALALAATSVSYVLFFLVITFRHMYLFAPLATVFSAYYISYKAFHEPDAFLVAKPALEPNRPEETRRKYEKSGISEEEGDLLRERLDRVMRTKRPYTDSDLTLPKLAALLQSSPHHLSQLLNQRLGTSFYDYVNRLRVEEVKHCLQASGKLEESVLDIALECGFNSKSAFNRIFKQHTSLSPTQFRQRTMESR
jgi:AraC-like DNA-binding protein